MKASPFLSEQTGHEDESAPSALDKSSEGEPMSTAQHTPFLSNGNDLASEGIPVYAACPPKPEKIRSSIWPAVWRFARSEWKWLFTLVVPALIAGKFIFMPASTAEVEKVRIEAGANLTVLKTGIDGQFQVVHTRIDGLQRAADETRSDIKELLKRTPPQPAQLSYSPPSITAPAPPAVQPAANPLRRPKKVPQPQKAGLLSLFR